MAPKEECEILLEALLSASENLLEKNGEFYPIGAVLLNDATTALTAAYSENELPDSKEIIQDLIVSHKQMAQNNEIKASGIAWNAAVAFEQTQTDAIIISLEHQDNYSVIVGLPYEIDAFNEIKYGELFAQSGNNDVF